MGIDGSSLITDGWFMEKNDMWPGQAMSLQVNKVLHHCKSQFQDILVFESTTYERVLVLDGVIQCTERDEFSYQEMMAHVPLFSHPNPEHVLVIGGGDGGVVREVLKHPSVKDVTLCELDPMVVDVAKQLLPKMSASLSNEKVTIVHEDGTKFLEEHRNHYDVIITDSSDPIGPAQSLFEQPFYAKLKAALKADAGIICCQGECIWLHAKLIKSLLTFCQQVFPVATYAYTTIPTYPSGQIGFILCSNSPECNFKTPLRADDATLLSKSLSYYNPSIHQAAFVLPEFARKLVEDEEKE